MRQVSQNYRTGRLSVDVVPVGLPGRGHVLVRTTASLVSSGTERSMMELAQKSLIGKAMARPDLVKRVIAKAKADGVLEAWRQAMGRLDVPVALGYSSAGVVVEVGDGVDGLAVGDRVACTGQGYAGHQEVASVPANLCARIPAGVQGESAAFAALGGIALEAVRVAHAGLGDTVVVLGLGLLGQITVQVLKAAGCHVIGMDIDPRRAEMALGRGVESAATDYDHLAATCRRATSSNGVDAVIIMASSDSNEPMEQAAELCREKGRIVATGQVGLEVPRRAFYDKELELVVSRAWGPGVYDPAYTARGLDYPIGYARWTAGRNIGEFLRLLEGGRVHVDDLITHRFPLERAQDAYRLILEGDEPCVGVVLTYPEQSSAPPVSRKVRLGRETGPSPSSRAELGVGVIGGGLFARSTMLPALKKTPGLSLRGIAAATGLSARHAAQRFGFDYCATNYREIIQDLEVDLVFVLTRHGSHAAITADCLESGKHVFVEKPLALDRGQLGRVEEAYRASRDMDRPPVLMLGFNRRYSSTVQWLRDRFSRCGEPMSVHYTVNAGPLPLDHWTYDPEEGGGRIIGEVCHFVDLVQLLTGSHPVRVHAESLSSAGYDPTDNVAITLKMADGGIASISYAAGGDKGYPKERVEVFGGGAVGVIDNFRSASYTHRGRTRKMKLRTGPDWGHAAEVRALTRALVEGRPLNETFEGYVATTLTTFAAQESLRQSQPAAPGMEQ
ncbi:MAG: bi-domain-containing oxidoreductase [Dehalococcoidia bacterium]|nr:bi-domain-containing oxidoreductase [Dehalococcoidia bacterium]